MATRTEQERELEGDASRIERLRAWSRTKHERPPKLTGEQILARRQERKEAKAARAGSKPPRQASSLVRTVLIVAMLGGAVVLSNQSLSNADDHRVALAELDAQVAAATLEVNDIRDANIEAKEDPAAGAQALAAAQEAATEVAELQNEYHSHHVSTRIGEDGLAVVVGAEERQEIYDGLSARFTEATLFGGTLDPASQWYLMWTQDSGEWEVAPGDAYAWTAPQVWSVVDGNTARVVWELYEIESGDMLGWASASYHAGIEQFDDVRLGITTQGQSRIAPTDSSIAGDSDEHEPAPGSGEDVVEDAENDTENDDEQQEEDR